MEKHELIGAIEAILFVAGDPVPIDDIAETLELTSSEAAAILDELMFSRASAQRGVLIRKIADKVQFVTNPKYAIQVEALLNRFKYVLFLNPYLKRLLSSLISNP
jgi:segregation and condensation protein B